MVGGEQGEGVHPLIRPRPCRPLKLLLAPNAFKGTLGAAEAAEAIVDGLRSADPALQIDLCPLADGGDGTLDILAPVLGASLQSRWVTGPFGDPVRARFALTRDGRTAIVELAEAAGLRLCGGRRDPMTATTFGVGELLRHVSRIGAKTVIVGVGGSATVDGGAGIAEALGWRLCDARGLPIPPGGGGLAKLDRLDGQGLDPAWRGARCIVLADVRNPLLGPRGAAPVFGPQKGASPAQVRALARNLSRFTAVIVRTPGAKRRSGAIGSIPGGGAAGGAAAGMFALLGARIVEGGAWIADRVRLGRRIRASAVVITGEGELDRTSFEGKATGFAIDMARRHRRPCFAVSGRVTLNPREQRRRGLTGVIAIGRKGETPEESRRHVRDRLRAAGAALAEVIRRWGRADVRHPRS